MQRTYHMYHTYSGHCHTHTVYCTCVLQTHTLYCTVHKHIVYTNTECMFTVEYKNHARCPRYTSQRTTNRGQSQFTSVISR
uniref:Uncharacterized protein n=1 Tax=Anguilla anguilla TaxID=7936 RepID=A0A0E9VGR0_ANGAN